jgi:hypothetical protein
MQETVTQADITKDKGLLDSINLNLDLHCAFARKIFPEIAHLSDEEIKEQHSDKRTFAKAPRFN